MDNAFLYNASHVFLQFVLYGFAGGILFWLCSPWLNFFFRPQNPDAPKAALRTRNFFGGCAFSLLALSVSWLFGFDILELSLPSAFPLLFVVYPAVLFLVWLCCSVASDVVAHPQGFSTTDTDKQWLTDKPDPEPSTEKAKPDLVPITELTIEGFFPDEWDGIPLRYRYDDVYIPVPYAFFREPRFEKKETCPFLFIGYEKDDDALYFSVFNNDCVEPTYILAKVPDNKLGRMAKDWYDRGDTYHFPITAIDPEHCQITITMLFYREGRHPIPMDEPGEESYRLIGNSRNAEMQEQIDLCEAGDDCTLEYDADKDKYLVSCGAPIGYLPKAARRLVDEYGADDVTVTIDNVGVDSDGRSWVCVVVDV